MTAVTHAPEAAPTAALAPLVRDLLERSRRDAQALESAAEADGQVAVDDAERHLETALAQAREQGAAEGRTRAAEELATARRGARTRVLAAQADLYDQARRAAGEAVAELLSSGGRERLRVVLRRRLGEAAEVRDAPDGGLVATGGDGRVIDASARALADGALAGLDVGELWSQP